MKYLILALILLTGCSQEGPELRLSAPGDVWVEKEAPTPSFSSNRSYGRTEASVKVYDIRELMVLLDTKDEMVVINWLYLHNEDMDVDIKQFNGALLIREASYGQDD